MRLSTPPESLLIRRNNHMRSLFITYDRLHEHQEVNASLLDLNHPDTRFQLTIITADRRGIQVKLPVLLTGMFDLKIKDGNQRMVRRIALQ